MDPDHPASDSRGATKTFWVAGAIVAAIVIIVVVLAGGGSPTGTGSDAAGDVTISEGPAAPPDITLADITAAEVRKEGPDVVFEVTLDAVLPRKLKDGNLDLRFDISEDGADTWIVAANLNAGPTASVTSLKSNFGASTIDGTLAGSIAVAGSTLTIALEAGAIQDFPTAFTWRLTSTLDAHPADPGSATATDTAPDSGPGTLE